MVFANIVVGSGPAGVSCAVALLAQGQPVLMIDGGADLEPRQKIRLATLQQMPPGEWTGGAGDWLREGMTANADGIPLKLAYGSDFPYRAMPGAPRVAGAGVNTRFSLAKGGLSTVWGAAVMPFRQHDLDRWPITAHDLAPHYRAVLDFMPVAQENDRLAEDFPVSRETQAMPMSAQAKALLDHLDRHSMELKRKGLTFGKSRLAVNALGRDAGHEAPGACTLCGLCMYGCPYELIYSTAQTVEKLKSNPDFRYVPGRVVQRLDESGARVRVHTINSDGSSETLEAERVFVGAGVLASTSLMLRSLEAYDRTVEMKEAHYFLLPMLRLQTVPAFERRNLHTLAQAFLELMDEAVSPYTIHLQTYTYNELFELAVAQKLGASKYLFPWGAFLSRLFLFQGYLHSDHSPLTEATLRRNDEGDVLQLEPRHRPVTDEVRKRLIAKLQRLSKLTGLRPLSRMLRPGEPGRGFHTGCSFPMNASPKGLCSDVLGRPGGLGRVHVIDSSVMTTVPATTITYTVMANAHRIGTLAAQGVEA